jgi:hypothetical protein
VASYRRAAAFVKRQASKLGVPYLPDEQHRKIRYSLTGAVSYPKSFASGMTSKYRGQARTPAGGSTGDLKVQVSGRMSYGAQHPVAMYRGR